MNQDKQQPISKKNVVHLKVINNPKTRTSRRPSQSVSNHYTSVASKNSQNNKLSLSADSFIVMRINEFDILGETFGNEVANELAALVIGRIQACLRPEDIFDRINTNEFAIMVTGVSSKQLIEKQLLRIEKHCNGEYVCSNLKLHISLKTGVSIASHSRSLYEEQLRFARIALRRAEQNSATTIEFFSPDMLDDLQDRAAMIFELHQAIKQQRFELHYQPQYDVQTMETVALEALIRMKGQDDNLIFPDRFIDLAEKTGLILPIGHWVIQQACRQYKQWLDIGCAPKRISVNVSSKQLADTSLIEIVDAAIIETGIDYSNLELEITEQSLIQKITLAEKVLKELSDKGVRIALDDFGTGYSSLAYLDQLPLNVLKIDRSFLQQWNNNNRTSSLIKSIVFIAKELDLEVVVEGVENREQQSFIESMGAHLGQGYGYCRPQNVETITSMLLPSDQERRVSI